MIEADHQQKLTSLRMSTIFSSSNNSNILAAKEKKCEACERRSTVFASAFNAFITRGDNAGGTSIVATTEVLKFWLFDTRINGQSTRKLIVTHIPDGQHFSKP